MCLVVLSTAHPSYPFILLSNRDEYLKRPTASAEWWSPPAHSASQKISSLSPSESDPAQPQVLSGRDLQHPTRGTWLGLTKTGLLAALTNFRESDTSKISGTRSRGEIAKAYLCKPPEQSAREFVKGLVEDDDGLDGVGGFSMMFGRLRRKHLKLGVVSNRARNEGDITWVLGRQETDDRAVDGGTVAQACSALSNSHFGDRKWPKVNAAEEKLQVLIKESEQGKESLEQIVQRGFELLSTDTMPPYTTGRDLQEYLNELRKSIFIPVFGVREGPGQYGTQKQTVVIVDVDGKATFVERTLVDHDQESVPSGQRDRRFDFQIDGWNDV